MIEKIKDKLAEKCILIHYDVTDNEEWLDVRENGIVGNEKHKAGIGGSTSAAILNMYYVEKQDGSLNHYNTANKAWHNITRRSEDLIEGDNISFGKYAEVAMLKILQERHPDWVIFKPDFTIYRKDKPYIFSNLDGIIVYPDGEMGILEIKITRSDSYSELPLYHEIQCRHNTLIGCGVFTKPALLFVNHQNSSFKEYYIDCDEKTSNYMINEYDKFWNYNVLQDVEPLLPALTYINIQKLTELSYKDTNVVVIPEQVKASIEKYIQLEKKFCTVKADIEILKAVICGYLNNETKGIVENTNIEVFWDATQKKFNGDYFKLNYPDLYNKYYTKHEGYSLDTTLLKTENKDIYAVCQRTKTRKLKFKNIK